MFCTIYRIHTRRGYQYRLWFMRQSMHTCTNNHGIYIDDRLLAYFFCYFKWQLNPVYYYTDLNAHRIYTLDPNMPILQTNIYIVFGMEYSFSHLMLCILGATRMHDVLPVLVGLFVLRPYQQSLPYISVGVISKWCQYLDNESQ